jgi:hypothetical protein
MVSADSLTADPAASWVSPVADRWPVWLKKRDVRLGHAKPQVRSLGLLFGLLTCRMKTLLYLSYGRGPHEREVIYSVYTARHCSPNAAGFRILIYTDHPDSFASVPADVEFISTQQWNAWGGPHNFNHRRKILALQHAISKNVDSVILIDGDTWWRGAVESLFRRVDSGRTLMHIREGSISEINGPRIAELRSLVSEHRFNFPDGSAVEIPGNCQMWNAGVIGLHPHDAPILDDVIHLTDQFCSKSDLHILEQFAFSFLLQTKTALHEASDLVFHYWPPYLHAPFRRILPGLLKSAEELEGPEKAAWLFARRPRPTTLRRGKVIIKRLCQWMGLIRGQSRSNEW